MALPRAKLGVSLFRHPCRKPLSPRKGLFYWGYRPSTKQGCLQSATQSHYARTHNDSRTKPLHDATAQMAVNAQMQWHKWLTTCTGALPQSKDALVACQKFCTMQNQQSKQHSTSPFLSTIEIFRLSVISFLCCLPYCNNHNFMVKLCTGKLHGS